MRTRPVASILKLGSLVLLVSCGGFSGPPNVVPAQPNSISLGPQSWYILYSDDMPNHPLPSADGAWSVNLPDNPGSVNYVQTPFFETTPHSMITITFRVDSSSNVDYNGRVDPDAANPATFHLFMERRDDDFTNEYYRWWSAGYILGSKDNSVVTIEAPLTSDAWTSVYGHHDATEFADTLNHLGWVGFTFGGVNRFGHGVNLLSGTAKFTLLNFQVE
jgi:hypothetical protein